MPKQVTSIKSKMLAKNQIHATDTGSPESQIAMLTENISKLTEHLKINPKDFSSRRGLLKQVGRRKTLLKYVASISAVRYKKIIAANGLKG
jgi:small subunit ribosomal protein S15